MTTLTLLKAAIADDLERTDLTSAIATSISSAIRHFQTTRFYFNESRLSTFVTVATQSLYDVDDDADIPNWIELDYVKVVDSDGQIYTLGRADPEDIEDLLYTGAASGRPFSYSYFEESFRLFPVPDAVYTIRPVGLIRKAEPASDGEVGNVWMVEAFELIRANAKWRLATDKLFDDTLAAVAMRAEQRAMDELSATSSRKTATGQIRPTAF